MNDLTFGVIPVARPEHFVEFCDMILGRQLKNYPYVVLIPSFKDRNGKINTWIMGRMEDC